LLSRDRRDRAEAQGQQSGAKNGFGKTKRTDGKQGHDQVLSGGVHALKSNRTMAVFGPRGKVFRRGARFHIFG
jgi:hypothetical protein